MMTLKIVSAAFTFILFAMVVSACNVFAQPTPTTFVLPLPSPIVTLTQAPVTPTATLALPSPGLPTLPPQSASTVTPPPQAQPTTSAKRISFAPGTMSATVQGNVAANSADMHVLRALAGQVMSVTFSPAAENVTIQISGADGSVLASGGAKLTTGVFNLTQTQDYFFSIISSRNTPTNYSLLVTIPPLQSPVVNVPTPTAKRISFAPGGTSASVQGVLPKNGMDRWVIRVQAGQTMMAKAIPQNGNVMLIVFGVDGDVYQTDHAGSPDFSQQMRTTQDYYIDVRAWGDTAPSYTLQVTVLPIGQVAPTPASRRITFPSGGISTTVQSSIAGNGLDRYVVRVSAGQILDVSVSPPGPQGSLPLPLVVSVYSTDHSALMSERGSWNRWYGQLFKTQDYVIEVHSTVEYAFDYLLYADIGGVASEFRRITFAPGASTASVQGSSMPGQDRFVIRAQAGQTMIVNAASAQSNVILIIYGVDGNVLISDHAGATSWTGVLPTTQDYFINTRSVASNVVPFTLQITIPPK